MHVRYEQSNLVIVKKKLLHIDICLVVQNLCTKSANFALEMFKSNKIVY